jgi:hypothetical protein
MPPVPPIAPPMESGPEAPAMGSVDVKCAARDCMHNTGGACSKASINVSADAKCESYDPKSGGGEIQPPAPPLPFGMGM